MVLKLALQPLQDRNQNQFHRNHYRFGFRLRCHLAHFAFVVALELHSPESCDLRDLVPSVVVAMVVAVAQRLFILKHKYTFLLVKWLRRCFQSRAIMKLFTKLTFVRSCRSHYVQSFFF